MADINIENSSPEVFPEAGDGGSAPRDLERLAVPLLKRKDLQKGPPFDYTENYSLWKKGVDPFVADLSAIQGGIDTADAEVIGAEKQIEALDALAEVGRINEQGAIESGLAPSKIIDLPGADNVQIRVTPLENNLYAYEAVVNGDTYLNLSGEGWFLTPDNFTEALQSEDMVNRIRKAIGDHGGLVQREKRESWVQTLSSGMQEGLMSLPGTPAWIANSALAVPDIFATLGDWASKGFPEDHPIAKGKFTHILSQPEGTYAGSPEQFARLAQNLGDHAGTARRFINESIGTVTIPMIKQEIGFGNFLSMLEFDTSPQNRDKTQKYLGLLGNILGAAPVEGALVGKLLHKLSKTPGPATEEKLLDEMSSWEYSLGGEGFFNWRSWASPRSEMWHGALGAGGMGVTIETLPEDAPEWAQQIVALGGAFILPPAVSTSLRTSGELLSITPIVQTPIEWIQKGIGPIHQSGIQRAAWKELREHGVAEATESSILDVQQHLELAVSQGSTMDMTSFITYTTPQLARWQANILEARLANPQTLLSEGERARLTALVPDLRKYAAYQERRLKTIYGNSKIVTEVYADHAQRLLERRNKLSTALEKVLPVGDGVSQVPMSAEQIDLIENAFQTAVDKSIAAAQERIKALNEGRPARFETEEDRIFFNRMIRDELRAAASEMSAYESLLYRHIPGFDKKLTSEILIDEVPIGEWASNYLANRTPAQSLVTPAIAYKLSGRGRITEQKLVDVEDNDAVIRLRARIENLKADRQVVINGDLARAKEELGRANRAVNNINRRVNPRGTKNKKDLVRAEAQRRSVKNKIAKIEDSIAKQDNKIRQQQTNLERIYLDRAVDTSDGSTTVGAVAPTKEGLLDARTNDDGTIEGWSAEDLNAVLSDIKREVAQHRSSPIPNNLKITELENIQGKLEEALETNFNLPPAWMKMARAVSQVKNAAFAARGVADLLQQGRDRGPKVTLEDTSTKVLRKGEDQRPDLRELQLALTRVQRGEDSPLVPGGTKTRENPEGLQLNPVLLPGGDPAAAQRILDTWRDVPPPFEPLGSGPPRRTGYRVAKGTPVTPENIQIVEGILWDRFSALYNVDTGLNTSGARDFVTNNDAAITWLENAKNSLFGQGAGIRRYQSAFRDITAAEEAVRKLATLMPDNIDQIIRQMLELNVFKDLNVTESSLRTVLENAAENQQNLASLKVLFDGTDLALQGETVLDAILSSKNPKQRINEILHVLKQGELADGTNPALEGYKTLLAEAIQKRIQSSGRDTNTAVGKSAERLSEYLGQDDPIYLLDNAKLKKLLDPNEAEGVQFRILVDEAFGGPEWASRMPNEETPSQYLAKVATAIEQAQLPFPASTQSGVAVGGEIPEELIGNLGRMFGTAVARKTHLVNALVAAGIGRRAAVSVAKNLSQASVERLIYEGLMDPQFAMVLMKKYEKFTPSDRGTFLEKVKDILHRQVWLNVRRAQHMTEDAPGSFLEILRQATDDDLLEEPVAPQIDKEGFGRYHPFANQTSLPRANSASLLSQVNPISPQNAISPQMLQRYQQVFPEDRFLGDPALAAKDGGIVTLDRKKARQRVG